MLGIALAKCSMSTRTRRGPERLIHLPRMTLLRLEGLDGSENVRLVAVTQAVSDGHEPGRGQPLAHLVGGKIVEATCPCLALQPPSIPQHPPGPFEGTERVSVAEHLVKG